MRNENMTSVKFRRIYFWFLAILFLATVPVVIFYSLGYRYNPEKGIFIYAGSITIKSNPQQVEVYIDKKPVEKKKVNRLNSSYQINGIKPGNYLLEIKSSGFNDWSKKITVQSGISTEFWNVILTKKEYPRTKYETQGIDNFYLSPKKDLIAYAYDNGGEFLVRILDLNSQKTEQVFSSLEYKFTDNEKENIEWSSQAHKIIIPALKNGEKNYFIADVKSKETANLKDIVQASGLRDVRWDPDNKDFVYCIIDKSLHRINLKDPNEKSVIASETAGYGFASSYLYYFQLPSGIVYKADPKNGKITAQITTSPPENMDNPDYKIVAYDEKRIAVFNENGKLFIYNKGEKDKYFKKLSDEVSGIQFSDDGKKLLYWNDWEISVYFTADWEVQPQRNENEIKNITRFSQPVKNVQWAKDYEHVLFTIGSEVKVIELDHRNNRSLMDIIRLNTDSAKLADNHSQNKLFFIDEEETSRGLYSIDFPEKNGILGI